jgi:SHS2 domain-containing protein
MARYEQVPHTADLAAKIYGKSLPELFENAAFAMMDMSADLEDLASGETITLELEAPDEEDLLVCWLNEILYASVSENILFFEFHVLSITDCKLVAEAIGQRIGEDEDRIRTEIKAATYHDVKIEKTESGYEVTVVFDV